MSSQLAQDGVAYRRLMERYARLPTATAADDRWLWLMAAHVTGQRVLALHAHSHWQMLGLALRSRDWPELAGQCWRLPLVPLGHLLRRLPVGNVGRSTVSAFAPMRPPAAVQHLIDWARSPAGVPRDLL